jgi:Tfp pilus assembly protein PilN
VKAINLIPAGTSHGASAGGFSRLSPAHAVLGALVVVLAFVTVYVLSANSVSDRKAKLATLQSELASVQAQADKLAPYSNYAKLAQARTETVLQIASTRFDWHGALADLSKVIPANLRLQSLLATVAPGVTVSGAGGSSSGGGASTGSLRSDIAAPAFELRGCTTSHDDVARLVTRLQLINGVQRVTLADSTRSAAAAANAHGSTPSAATGVSTQPTVAKIAGCGNNPAAFDLVVFFTPLAGASPTGPAGSTPATGAPSTPVATTPATSAPSGSSSAASSSTSSTPATPNAPATPSASAPSAGTPAAAASSANSAGQAVSNPTSGGSR